MGSLLTTVRDIDRLRQIATVLVRHGFGQVVSRTGIAGVLRLKSTPPPQMGVSGDKALSIGERLRLVMQDLGPTFVKLGQIISTRPDLIPEDICQELKRLQDDVEPVPFEELRPHVEAELGANLTELFEQFDDTPLASASIGQVHRAKLRADHDITDVVVKIQRPGIQSTVERDLDLLHIMARALERTMPETRVYSPSRMVEEFDRAIRAELDFSVEADNAERFAQNFANDTQVQFPDICRPFSSRRVLTMGFLPGCRVDEARAHGHDGERISKTAVQTTIKMIFDDGFFHADPHPGNVLVSGTIDRPTLGLVDLGLVGRLTPRMRDRTIDLMVAAVRRDYRGLADALYALGKPSRKVDRSAFEAEVALLADKYLGRTLGDIAFTTMIADLIGGARRFGIQVPPEFLMVAKTLMTVEGVGKQLYPELDVFEEVKPYFLNLLKRRYAPERLSNELLGTALRLSNVATDLPPQLQELFDDLRKGALQMQVRDPGLLLAARELGRRFFGGLFAGSLVIAAAILISADHLILGGVAIMAALLGTVGQSLFLSLLARRKRRQQ